MKLQRYLVISDVLYSKESKIEDERWFPPQVAFVHALEKAFNGVLAFLGIHPRADWSGAILRSFDRSTKENFLRMLDVAGDMDYFDAIIGAGNYTIGTRESGMITNQAAKQFKAFDYRLHQCLEDIKRVFAPGGHDIGYRYYVKDRTKILKIGNETGGLSEESIAAYCELVGPLWGIEDLGNARVLYISTGLIRNVKLGESSTRLQVIRHKQYDFLQETLEVLDSSKPTFLVMHDPTALPLDQSVIDLLWKHRNKISAIIHGHSRARFVAKLTKLNKFYRKLCNDFIVICNPAPAGMFGIGKGFTVLMVTDKGAWYHDLVSLK